MCLWFSNLNCISGSMQQIICWLHPEILSSFVSLLQDTTLHCFMFLKNCPCEKTSQHFYCTSTDCTRTVYIITHRIHTDYARMLQNITMIMYAIMLQNIWWKTNWLAIKYVIKKYHPPPPSFDPARLLSTRLLHSLNRSYVGGHFPP